MKFKALTVVNTEITSGIRCHGVWKYQWIKMCILQTTQHHIPEDNSFNSYNKRYIQGQNKVQKSKASLLPELHVKRTWLHAFSVYLDSRAILCKNNNVKRKDNKLKTCNHHIYWSTENLYLGGAQLESQLGQHLLCPRYFVVLHSPSRQMLGMYPN